MLVVILSTKFSLTSAQSVEILKPFSVCWSLGDNLSITVPYLLRHTKKARLTFGTSGLYWTAALSLHLKDEGLSEDTLCAVCVSLSRWWMVSELSKQSWLFQPSWLMDLADALRLQCGSTSTAVPWQRSSSLFTGTKNWEPSFTRIPTGYGLFYPDSEHCILHHFLCKGHHSRNWFYRTY